MSERLSTRKAASRKPSHTPPATRKLKRAGETNQATARIKAVAGRAIDRANDAFKQAA